MTSDHVRYVEWDAAYVLGALSPADRRDFEGHLEQCERCRAAVAELTALPGLLGRIDDARAFALLEEAPELDVMPTDAIVERIRVTDRTRRSRRIRLVAGLAAAALAGAAAIAVPAALLAAPPPTLSTELAAVTAGPLSARVKLTSVGWGTSIEMSCSYSARTAPAPATPGPWSYALWVIDEDGEASPVSSWQASDGSTAELSAGTSLEIDEIASIEIRSVATGEVMLATSLDG